MGTPRISYARSADGVSLAFTVTGAGPALVFVLWVPFSNLRMEWRSPFLSRAFKQMARRLTLVHFDGRELGIRSATSLASRLQRWLHPCSGGQQHLRLAAGRLPGGAPDAEGPCQPRSWSVATRNYVTNSSPAGGVASFIICLP